MTHKEALLEKILSKKAAAGIVGLGYVGPVRLETLEHFWREAITMTVHSVLAMAALAAALMVLLRVVIPLLPTP